VFVKFVFFSTCLAVLLVALAVLLVTLAVLLVSGNMLHLLVPITGASWYTMALLPFWCHIIAH
jgi:hypothetical protein